MAFDAHPAFGFTTVAAGGAPSPATSGTSLTVASGTGALFADYPMNATVSPANSSRSAMATTSEIVRVTGRSGDVLTITRAQEGTTARTIVDGDEIAITITPKVVTDVETEVLSNATQIALQGAQIEVQRIAHTGYYVNSTGGSISVTGAAVGASATRLNMAAVTNFVLNTELIIAAKTNQVGLATAQNTTVAAGSNGVDVNTFAGSGTLNVASTTGFASSGTLLVGDVSGNVAAVVTYTGTSGGNSFTGCTFINSGQSTNFTMATSDTVYGSNADITYPRWAVIELGSDSSYNLNLGTASATPVFPTITTTRVPHAFLYIPANATSIDTLTTTPNGNAKLFDARSTQAMHPARNLASTSTTVVTLSNNGTLTTLLPAPVTIPANSMSSGDFIRVICAGKWIPGATTASEMQISLLIGGVTYFDYTTATLTQAGNTTDYRAWTFTCEIDWTGTGVLSLPRIDAEFKISNLIATATVSATVGGLAAAANGAMGLSTYQHSSFLDGTTALDIDIKARRVTSAANSQIVRRAFAVIKHPVQ